jgi:hypothetical protein
VININDQVFVEIKEDSSNQMVDSYNITRKTNAPKITAIVTVGKNDSVMADNNLPGEKKTLRSTPGPMK